MNHEEIVALREKVEKSPGLQNLEKRLATELLAKSGQNGYGFIDPFTILFIISVILQVISLCRSQRSEADIQLDMANAHLLPPRKLMRLKRRLNAVWKKHCEEHNVTPGTDNPFFTAAVNAVKNSTREDISDIILASD